MPYLFATSLLTIVAGPFQPLPQMQPILPPQSQIPTVPWLQVRPPAPSTIEVSPNIGIHPYGPSFQFNGLTVYVEPIANRSMTFEPSPGMETQLIEVIHPLAQEPVAIAPVLTAKRPTKSIHHR